MRWRPDCVRPSRRSASSTASQWMPTWSPTCGSYQIRIGIRCCGRRPAWTATLPITSSHAEARAFLDQYARLLDLVADGYLREGKRYLTVAIGCTGGRHRSVAMAENLSARLGSGVETFVIHRDLDRAEG